MSVINLTPHEVNVYLTDGTVRVFAPSGNIARVAVQQVRVDGLAIMGAPIVREVYGAVTGLPASGEDTHIVSRMVAEACRGRRADLVFPTDTVRDEAGRIVGCRAFGVL